MSKKPKHTKGCWIAVGRRIEHEKDNVPDIANFDPASMGQDGRSNAESCANALLCAAAPEMLDILEKYVAYYELGMIKNLSDSEFDATGELADLCRNYLNYLT